MSKRSKATIEKEISDTQAYIDDASTPQDECDFAATEIEELKKELQTIEKKPKSSKPAKKSKKKATPVHHEDVDKDLSECKELIQANRKPRPEPVHHTKATRFDSSIKTVLNVLLEDQTDAKTIEKIDDTVTDFIIKCKEDFLGLKITKPSEAVTEKLETALEKAES